MVLSYKFKKIKLKDGSYVRRPFIDIIIKNGDKHLEFGALLDSGSDITTIPKSVADYLEIRTEDKEVDMIGYKSIGNVKHGKVTIIFKEKVKRLDEILNNVPVAVMQDTDIEEITIGTLGVFEHFKIVFNDTKDFTLTRLVSFR